MRVHYQPASPRPGHTRVETFPVRLADDSWHRLAVIVSGDQIEVIIYKPVAKSQSKVHAKKQKGKGKLGIGLWAVSKILSPK